MRFIILTIQIIFFAGSIYANSNEPCKAIPVLSAENTQLITFELPTYDEYIMDVVNSSTTLSVNIDEQRILNQTVFERVRKEKINIIKKTLNEDQYVIMTKSEVENSSNDKSLVFKEVINTGLVEEENVNFEEYTSFVLFDQTSRETYTLIDPSLPAYSQCVVGKEKYSFKDVIALF